MNVKLERVFDKMWPEKIEKTTIELINLPQATFHNCELQLKIFLAHII